MKRFFIPSWLDDLDLKPNAFRVYCHLLRRAGVDGKCFTGGKAISTACRISKDTVWPTLTLLEEKGLIKRQGKKFGASNNFLVMHSIGGNEGLIDIDAIGGNGGLIDSLQSAETEGCQSAEMEGRQSAEMEGREETLFKKSTLKKPNTCALEIYEAYPRKKAREQSLAAISKALKTHSRDYLMEKTKIFAEQTKGTEERYIPYASTFFNQKRFTDTEENPTDRQSPTVNLGYRKSNSTDI